jgi:C-5 cytosine-specific DNA methylase
MRMLDLFSGSGAASRAAAVRGWDVVRIDNAEGTAADVRADLATWEPGAGDAFDLVWASPPCTQLSTANAATRDVDAGMVLVRAALRIIGHVRPRWWVLENVHGATRAIGALIGPPVATYGSFYLWGVFPPFAASVPRTKTKLSGRRRAERRAAIPWAISEGLVRACEQLARELGPRRGAGGGQVDAGEGLERGELGGSPGHLAAVPDLAPSCPPPAPARSPDGPPTSPELRRVLAGGIRLGDV